MFIKVILNSNILKNIFSLTVVQFATYIFPFLITPVVSRALGPEGYGEYLFFISITNYIFLIIDWGFQFYGPRLISLSKESNHMNIVYEIMASKLFLACIIFLLLIILSFFFDINYTIITLLCVTTLSFAFNPLFFLHGVGKIYISAVATFIIRLISLPIIFLTVVEESDLILLIIIFVSTQFLVSLVTFIYLKRNNFKIILLFSYLLKFSFIKTLKNSAKVFISNAFVTVYSNMGVILLGILSSNKAISIFGSSMLIISLSKSILNPISIALYPESAKMDTTKKSHRRLILKAQLVIGLLMSLIVYFSSELLINFFFGEKFLEAIFILKILSPIPTLVSLSNFFGVQILLAKGRETDFMIITAMGTIVITIILITLIPLYDSLAAAIAVLSCEFVVATGSIKYGYRFLKLEKKLINN